MRNSRPVASAISLLLVLPHAAEARPYGGWAQSTFAQGEGDQVGTSQVERGPVGKGEVPGVLATAHCFCKVSCVNLTGQTSASSVCPGYSWTLKTYTGINPQKEANQVDCQSECKYTAGPYIASQAVASACCSIGCASGSTLVAYSAVGVKEYRAAENIGVLQNTPPVTTTTCRCPTGWACNGCSPQVDGGITSDGQCKKLACQPNVISPPPANGTQIGSPSWGFSWGNAFYAWGSPANGGAPACTSVTTPGICKF